MEWNPFHSSPAAKQYVQNRLISMYRHIHLCTHVSMSSTYASLSQLLPVYPPNTTALWLSILVKVWLDSGGGLSPVVIWTAHTPAGTVTEQKCVSLKGPLDLVSYPPHHVRRHKRQSGEPSPISWACGVMRNVIIARFTFECFPMYDTLLVTYVQARASLVSQRLSASGRG